MNSLFLPPHDSADTNGKRFQRLWAEEVAKKGLEKASLERVVMRFQRTRIIMASIAAILIAIARFL
uniref:Uncharacterized protein n=1 Tax=Anguilla anguilla TaxID=7936 RepID=A0A0E9VIT2_ANGAN